MKELADAKAENDALRDDVAAGRRRLGIIKAVWPSVREATTRPPAWIMQPPPTGRHRWTGLFHPQREADHYARMAEPRSILMSSADELPISMAHAIIVVNIPRFQRSINA